MFTSSRSMGGDAKTIIRLKTLFGDIITIPKMGDGDPSFPVHPRKNGTRGGSGCGVLTAVSSFLTIPIQKLAILGHVYHLNSGHVSQSSPNSSKS